MYRDTFQKYRGQGSIWLTWPREGRTGTSANPEESFAKMGLRRFQAQVLARTLRTSSPKNVAGRLSPISSGSSPLVPQPFPSCPAKSQPQHFTVTLSVINAQLKPACTIPCPSIFWLLHSCLKTYVWPNERPSLGRDFPNNALNSVLRVVPAVSLQRPKCAFVPLSGLYPSALAEKLCRSEEQPLPSEWTLATLRSTPADIRY